MYSISIAVRTMKPTIIECLGWLSRWITCV